LRASVAKVDHVAQPPATPFLVIAQPVIVGLLSSQQVSPPSSTPKAASRIPKLGWFTTPSPLRSAGQGGIQMAMLPGVLPAVRGSSRFARMSRWGG